MGPRHWVCVVKDEHACSKGRSGMGGFRPVKRSYMELRLVTQLRAHEDPYPGLVATSLKERGIPLQNITVTAESYPI